MTWGGATVAVGHEDEGGRGIDEGWVNLGMYGMGFEMVEVEEVSFEGH